MYCSSHLLRISGWILGKNPSQNEWSGSGTGCQGSLHPGRCQRTSEGRGLVGMVGLVDGWTGWSYCPFSALMMDFMILSNKTSTLMVKSRWYCRTSGVFLLTSMWPAWGAHAFLPQPGQSFLPTRRTLHFCKTKLDAVICDQFSNTLLLSHKVYHLHWNQYL